MRRAVRFALAFFASSVAVAPEASAQPLPWEVWADLSRLAEITAGDRGLLRSSHCLSGCAYDRHSPGDWRYIRIDGGEGVVFEETGPGAITRIWMTMGPGFSEPLDPSIRVRIYIDEAPVPVVDLPLPDLFSGTTAPFLPPLVATRKQSSGGNVSYVPIPYRTGCRVSLVGADEKTVWFQFSSRRLASADGVTSFTGAEDLAAWAALLKAPGRDPWPPSPLALWAGGDLSLEPGGSGTLLDTAGADSINALRLDVAPQDWSRLEIEAHFDGEERVRMPVADFFAVGRGGQRPTRSLLVGLGEEGLLYCWFPMPYFHGAKVSVRSLAAPGSPPVAVGYAIRRAGTAPSGGSAPFGALLSVSNGTTPGTDFPVLRLQGQGRWVGLFAELGSVGTLSRAYLEGDERVFLDDSPHPEVYGTGIEDFFGGGFYFDLGPFGLALHGSPYHLIDGGSDLTAAYRLLLTDAVPFANGIQAGLESGPVGDVSMSARTVAYYYLRRAPGLVRRDVLELTGGPSREQHCYSAEASPTLRRMNGRFEGEPGLQVPGAALYRGPGAAQFVLRGAVGPRVRIRRRLDAGQSWQRADLFVNGQLAGTFPPVEANPARRWRETELDLPAAAGDLTLTVVAQPDPGSLASSFTEARYELWSSPGPSPPSWAPLVCASIE
jgi:hypothetical protein